MNGGIIIKTKAMTVRQLKKLLQNVDDDNQIFITDTYGTLVPLAQSNIDMSSNQLVYLRHAESQHGANKPLMVIKHLV